LVDRFDQCSRRDEIQTAMSGKEEKCVKKKIYLFEEFL
jgi:hypothetical protein